MNAWRRLVRVLPAFGLACTGTGTGNPMDSNPSADAGAPEGGDVTPAEFELLMSSVPRATAPQLDSSSAERFATDNRGFAFDLLRQLANPNENLFFSPYGISAELAMTYAGAQAATESEMRQALHFGLPEPELHIAFDATSRALLGRKQELFPDATGDGFELGIVNQTWGQLDYPFLGSYLDVLAIHYGSGVLAVDFRDNESVRQTINRWVLGQTGDRVGDLLPAGSLTSDARLVLTNAAYFRASWLSEFDPAATAPGVFHASGGDRPVSMMHQTLEAAYAATASYQALELPYFSNAVRMTLILPAEGAFASVANSLDETFFQGLRSALGIRSTNVTLPRFGFASQHTLKAPLSSLGMPGAFLAGADLSALCDSSRPLRIFEVHQGASIAVDEEGTEAVASTAVITPTEIDSVPAVIAFDRPFLFLIYDEPSGQILFLGQLVDPV